MGTFHPAVPRWPARLLAACAALAAISILQGIVDVVIPASQGELPFGLLLALTERFGPWFLGLWVFVHNLGLACLVPGIGFVAARFERRTENRGHIGALLFAAVALAMLLALQYILVARERFDLRVALPLYVGEAAAVLACSWIAARELRGFVPTPAYGWSLLTPFRRIRPALAAAAVVLAALAVVEAGLVAA